MKRKPVSMINWKKPEISNQIFIILFIQLYFFRLQKLNDEYLEKKIEFGRELALSQQQNEFQTKKIVDLQSQITLLTERYEEKLSIL